MLGILSKYIAIHIGLLLLCIMVLVNQLLIGFYIVAYYINKFLFFFWNWMI
jgi:hypothetical protein